MTKRKSLRSIWLTILFILLFALGTPPTSAQDPPPSATESSGPFDRRFGIVDSFVNTAEANAAGAGWTRVFFRWDVVQPAGPTDWKPTNVPDPLLDAEIAAGREVVAVLIGTPAWATESGASTAVPPLEYWGDFVFKIATQYKGRISHWVIWNQPDITDPTSPSHTWDGSVEDYYHLLKEAYQKIKAVDPAMQVHLAGLTYTWDRDQGQAQYLARLLDLILADPQAAVENYYFDAVSYHLYYHPRQMLDILTDVRSILDAHDLANKPVWINETNAPPSDDYLEPLNAQSGLKVTLQEQSAFVIQAFALALAGGAERIAFNKLRNDYPHPEAVEPYGLLRGDNSRRPAFDAFRVVSTHFAGVEKVSWLQQGDVYVVTLARGEQTTTVLWNTVASPTTFILNAITPQAILVDDQANEQPITASNGVYAIELPGALCSNGPQACFIGGAPRLIVEGGSPDQRVPLLPLVSPTATPETPSSSAPSNELTPSTPVAPAQAEIDAPPPPPTLTPTPALAPVSAANGETLSSQENGSPSMAALPAPGVGQADPGDRETVAASPIRGTVPPVTILTVLRPDRILWLFIIGLIVFMVSYGVQVAIWYRLRR
jgi:hypothetical protein